jgi:hypothetical protein
LANSTAIALELSELLALRRGGGANSTKRTAGWQKWKAS